jgi:multiple sugar transport system permease protein
MAQATLPQEPGRAGIVVPTVRRQRVSEETRAGWIAVSPWVIGFLIFTFGPLIASLYFSFTSYDMLRAPRWVGIQNYQRLLTDDPLLIRALRNTVVYTLMHVPLHVASALGVALLLNEARQMKGFFRTAFYLPSMTPAVATAYLWILILNPNDGLVNRVLRFLHLPAPGWTTDPDWTKATIVISQIWMFGGAMIIYLAALKGVPQDLYEAAKLDGASAWQRFRGVTLPMISGATFFIATISAISSLNVFTQGYVMFDSRGGPENSALFVVMYLFRRAFENFQMGYAAAIAWILFVIIVAVTFVQFRFSKRWVYYEAGND